MYDGEFCNAILHRANGEPAATRKLLQPFAFLMQQLLGIYVLCESTNGLTAMPNHMLAERAMADLESVVLGVSAALQEVVDRTAPPELAGRTVEFVAASHKEKRKLSCMLNGGFVDLFSGSGCHQSFTLYPVPGKRDVYYVGVQFQNCHQRWLRVAEDPSRVINLCDNAGCNQEFRIYRAKEDWSNTDYVYAVESVAPSKHACSRRFMSYMRDRNHVDLWQELGCNQWWQIRVLPTPPKELPADAFCSRSPPSAPRAQQQT